ncbi:NAD-dependent epimerase/dehydratase family protein [Neisseria zoodegmatis]|uniref:NAD-dependent epimerase/dehydratase family protein n=1 Tax=Neisseria zoodegmatis TaxID=326523 RepID=UPI00350E59EF
MNVLILGGNGFIGRRAAAILRERGHEVVAAGRKECDYLRLDEAAVRSLLRGKDVVVNAVGVMSRHADILEQVHHRAPEQLAQWAEQEGVSRWVQLSALGADHRAVLLLSAVKGGATARCMLRACRCRLRDLRWCTGAVG